MKIMDAAPNEESERAINEALSSIDEQFLRDVALRMVSTPSPTGQERGLAEMLTTLMQSRGLEARYQPIDDSQGNSLARIRGSRARREDGRGADLLLYAPIDTLTSGDSHQDIPVVGSKLRADMTTQASSLDAFIVGLGASNPKGHGACIIAAADAIKRSGVPLKGDVLVGLGAGGMPTTGHPGVARSNVGHGVGCSFMLEQGWWADYAVIAKPGWAVHWEEVGLCWFDLVVKGTFSYVGSRHRMVYRNAIVDAGTLAQELDTFFHDYANRHAGGLLAPQGHIGAIDGGWLRMPAVSPHECRLRIDLRTTPDQTPCDVQAELKNFVGRVAAAHGIDVDVEMVLAIPGTRTPHTNWIVRSAIAGWEAEEGRPHEPIVGNSGSTDANILRSRGIPTARIGMDRIGSDAPLPLDFPAGMNVVDVRGMAKVTRTIVRIAVSTCMQEANEIREVRRT